MPILRELIHTAVYIRLWAAVHGHPIPAADEYNMRHLEVYCHGLGGQLPKLAGFQKLHFDNTAFAARVDACMPCDRFGMVICALRVIRKLKLRGPMEFDALMARVVPAVERAYDKNDDVSEAKQARHEFKALAPPKRAAPALAAAAAPALAAAAAAPALAAAAAPEPKRAKYDPAWAKHARYHAGEEYDEVKARLRKISVYRELCAQFSEPLVLRILQLV